MGDDELRLGPFRLEPAKRALLRGEKPVRLGSRAFDILCTLAHAGGDLVSKDALMAAVWPGQIVEENAIQVQVSALRKVLDEERTGTNYIVTVPGRGYRLIDVASSQPTSDSEGRTPHDTGHSETRSIAVLPFQNLSSDPEQEYFAEGIVEDVIAGLSRIKWLFVIARNSSFSYKGKSADLRQIGRELGVRYVLEGSVRKVKNRVRIATQLIDTTSGHHIWAERYDRSLDDIFALQDEIAMSVVGAVELSVRKAEIDRVRRLRPSNLNAYDLVLQSLPHVFSNMPTEAESAIPLLENALELEPDYSAAHAFLSWCLHARFARNGLHQEDRIAAIQHARAATMLDNDDATALAIAAQVLAFQERDTATELKLFDKALELSNSNIFALSCSATILAWMGKAEVAIERAQRALRLSPRDSFNFRSYHALAIAYFHTQRFEDAAAAANNAINANPIFSPTRTILAASLMRLDRVEEAKVAGRNVLECQPSFTIRAISAIIDFNPSVLKPFADAWREIGLPR